MLDRQPNDELTDERVPFVPCRLLAISEIEVDPHGDMNAEYERLYPNDPAFFPEPEYFDKPDREFDPDFGYPLCIHCSEVLDPDGYCPNCEPED